uniref:Uncharacterized protein n=1 Tax=Lotus japonicus TaxID=34305 RepID=I3SV72_LOTJA|nr:unknown [Lotus japonicus]
MISAQTSNQGNHESPYYNHCTWITESQTPYR